MISIKKVKMNFLVVISAVSLAYATFVSSENYNSSKLFQEAITPQDAEFLEKILSNFEEKSLTVLTADCPTTAEPSVCYDPNGNEGKCVDINECEHLVNLLKSNITPVSIEFLQNSRCRGVTPISVCCGPEPIKGSAQRKETCENSLSAYPPDPASGCCGTQSPYGDRIYGGDATAIDQYPWLALIDYDVDGETLSLCGGALLSARYVLTAAHCVVGDIGGEVKTTPCVVRLSEYDKSKDGPDCVQVGQGMDCNEGVIKIPIEDIIPHPEYDPSKQHNDIALIKLANLAPYTDFIRPICLPSVDVTRNPPKNFTTFMAGWGEVSPDVFSAVKMHVMLPFVELEQCQIVYNQTDLITTLWDKQLCAGGEKGKDACWIDSGGPLMFDNAIIFEAIGICSFGPEHCGEENKPGVYTKVIEYKDWILSNMKP